MLFLIVPGWYRSPGPIPIWFSSEGGTGWLIVAR